jgi:4-hydroxybenzoate polyprenyltransferase
LPGVVALLKIVHPFPSLLDAAVTGALAAIAGAPPARIALLAGVMVLLQFSIGAANDIADRAADALARRTDKPLATGRVSTEGATRLAVGLGGAGLLGATLAGPSAFLLAGAGYGLGIAYDAKAKRTSWSWLPFAFGIPLLPLFAWVGATGRIPQSLLLLAAMAVPAGAALAISNALGDAELDLGSDVRTVAGRLGRTRALHAVVALDGVVLAIAGATALATGPGRGGWLVAAGGLTLLAGIALAARRRNVRGWEVQAIGLAILAAGWVLVQVDAGNLV